MRPKRGTDHTWQIVKYKGDIALYAKCKCGYRYVCSENAGTSLKQMVVKIFPYCPVCGARKKYYIDAVMRVNKYSFE